VFAPDVVSIRWKLFLSLFVLTSGVCALVLGFAERQFRQSVREEVVARFNAQLAGLLEARAQRLARVRDLCSKLAEEESVRRQLRDPEPDRPPRDFLQHFESLRGEIDDPDPPDHRPGRSQRPPRELPLMGVVTLDGELRPLGRAIPDKLRRRRQPPAELRELARQPSQQVAYAVTETGAPTDPARKVQEVVVTPVREADGRMLGWFFLGRDAQTRDELLFQRVESLSGRETRTGLVVEDEWLVGGLPPDQIRVLAAARSEGAWADDKPDLVEIDGQPFLLATAPLNADSPLGRGYQVTLFPIGPIVDAIRELRWKVGAIGLLATLAAAAVALFLSARFNRPIAALVAGTERIRRGNLGQPVEIRSKDEFGRLAEAFNLMTRDLALKERYHEVLGKVSDPTVARRLMDGELELGGEVVEAAVLFCDIRGFTALTDGMPSGQVIELLNEHMTALNRVIYDHGGVVDKFVGDLVMALFGVPQSHGDDALRAARCAVAMIGARRRLDATSGRTVRIGIGVAHGPLVAGCMGSRDRLNYTVLGDRVNLASRLCDAAVPGEVLVDAAVAAVAGAEFDLAAREPMTLKGFAEPAAAFSIRP
jgi:class 3 adenylate cyclase